MKFSRIREPQVVGMPSTMRTSLIASGIPSSVGRVARSSVAARVAVEAGHGDFWYKYVGLNGSVVSQDTFGESAPGAQLFKEFGFTVENLVKVVKQTMGE